MSHYITTDTDYFQSQTSFDSFDAAYEAAYAIWHAGLANVVWICDEENRLIKKIRTTLDF